MFAPLFLASTLTLQAAAAATEATQSQQMQNVVIYDFAVAHAALNAGPSDSICDNNTLTPEAADVALIGLANISSPVSGKKRTEWLPQTLSEKLTEGVA